jgi:ABC-2 type transport system permease protein
VFTKFLKVGKGIPNYPIYLLLGIVLWNFFSEVTTNSVSAIVGSGDLIRKINFPKYVIILAGSFSALINLGLNLIIVSLFMVFSGLTLSYSALLFPFLILELFIFSLAVAFFLSAAFVRFRDLGYIWEVVLQAGFYITPILYPLTLVPIRVAKLQLLNPVAQIIQDSRYVLVTKETQTITSMYSNRFAVFVPLIIVISSAVISTLYFRSRSRYFAEEV